VGGILSESYCMCSIRATPADLYAYRRLFHNLPALGKRDPPGRFFVRRVLEKPTRLKGTGITSLLITGGTQSSFISTLYKSRLYLNISDTTRCFIQLLFESIPRTFSKADTDICVITDLTFRGWKYIFKFSQLFPE